jgi:hypothetical protein
MTKGLEMETIFVDYPSGLRRITKTLIREQRRVRVRKKKAVTMAIEGLLGPCATECGHLKS